MIGRLHGESTLESYRISARTIPRFRVVSNHELTNICVLGFLIERDLGFLFVPFCTNHANNVKKYQARYCNIRLFQLQ